MSIKMQAERMYRELSEMDWLDFSENYEEDIDWLEYLITTYGYKKAMQIAY